jgi:hypothetical protein
MHEALMGFLGGYWGSPARSSSQSLSDNYDSLTESFYKLFLVKYGFSADLDNDCPRDYNMTQRYPHDRKDDVHRSNLLTERALQDVIASQSVPFDRWSLDQRFKAAVHSQGWPAYSFVRLVDFDTNSHLAQYRDAQGRTALHWAAEQWATCVSQDDPRMSWRSANDRAQEYGTLLVELMMAGADVNALDSADQSPFANMMLSPHSWLPETLADATRKWGSCYKKPVFLSKIFWRTRIVY